MENELVSIIIPTYNRSHLIGETIKSIQNQSYTIWECIIVDDESTDDTENLILKYIDSDPRIRYFKKPKHLSKGPSASRNYGYTKSNGVYINWFDSDDLMSPEKLETDLKNITSGDYDFTISQSTFFSDNGDVVGKVFWNKNLWSNDPINDFVLSKIGWGINSPLWKKESLKKIKIQFDEQLMTADDYLYHIKAIAAGLKPIYYNLKLVSQREHPQRLNDFFLKSPSKLRVNNYLYSNKIELQLNDKVLFFLNKQYIRQFSNLLKNKQMLLALKFFFKSWRLNYFARTKLKLCYFIFVGLFYRIFGFGYNLLK